MGIKYLSLLLFAFGLGGCDDLVTPTTHLALGNPWDSTNLCLGPQQGFDTVDGPAPASSCPVVCVTDARTGTTYVTDQCPPFPAADTVEDSDASGDTCAAAVAAWNAGNECGAAVDASVDAPEEAVPEASVADSPRDHAGEASDATRD